MMRVLAARAGSRRELPSVAQCSVRYYLAPQSISFTEEVAIAKPSIKGEAPSVLESWKSQAAGTAQLLKLLQTYKEIGDSKNEPYLKYHNPRTFEDLSAPVPNFRALNLKAGEVPRFFDTVLSGRAADAVAKKSAWWAQRKKEAEATAKESPAPAALPSVPLPSWTYGKAVPLDSLKGVTDKYFKSLEPKRKLQVASVPASVKDLGSDVSDVVAKALADKAVVIEGGKALDGFKYVSKAVAARVLQARRAEVHERYVKYWAKKVLVSPEVAAVPLKLVDAQLASKFENVAPAYAELLSAAGAGPKTLAERLHEGPAFSNFFLMREKAEDVKAELPPTEAEAKGAEVAAKLDSPEAALKELLGPELTVLGGGSEPLSAQVRAITEHKYTPDRYLYKEGMALAAKLEAQENAAAAAGFNPKSPPTPVQQVVERAKAIAAQAPSLAADKAAADKESPYAAYVTAKKHQLLSDASNVEIEELQYPALTQELLDLELAEVAELEASLDDAEEEELWALTLAAQLKHLQKHFGVDLPHGVIAHMDPILFKKIDWETTNNLEDWDITLEDIGADYAKEQWGLETLSHHLLPLIRYRRAKARAQGTKFDPELAAPIR